MYFKCPFHKVNDPVLGDDSPLIFPWEPRRYARRPPRSVMCPADLLFTGFRVCPHCRSDLPYYTGRCRQRIVALTGCRAAGKTVYLWSLLHQIRQRLSRAPQPFAVAMFEDDLSYCAVEELCNSLERNRIVPEATQANPLMAGELRPIIVRVLQQGNRRLDLSNLVFYDPPGELIENLSKTVYLRYLAHSAGIIYLVDPPNGKGSADNDAKAALASEALGGIVRQVRIELRIAERLRLPIALAVAVAKADEFFFDYGGRDSLVPRTNKGSKYWYAWTSRKQLELARSGEHCQNLLREFGFDNLVNIATSNFNRVQFFALSSLSQSPVNGRLTKPPIPDGVENPLFWILHSMK